MYTHYAPMVSYYSAKTRACLGYKRIPFVEVYEPATYRDRIAPAVGRTVFPVLESDEGEILQDTTVIIDALEQRHAERPVFPKDPVLMLVSRIVEFFVDELWVVTAMQTRWNDPDARRFVIAEFNRFFGQGDAEDIWANGDAVAERMQSYLPAIGLDNEPGQRLVQRLFEEATELLDRAVGPRQFAFGPRPSLADCCLYAAYYPHQYRDHGTAQAHLKTKAANLCYFLDNMHAAYGMPAEGELGLTEPFLAYLRYIGPIGAAYATSVEQLAQPVLAAAAPGEEVEQGLTPEIELFGETYRRFCTVFSAWKAQRVREAYECLSGTDRERGDALMADIGWGEFLGFSPHFRMERVGFALQRAG